MAYVSPAVDQATRTFPVEVLVENADRTLKPGFFAKGTVLTHVDDEVLAAPDDAVSTMAGVSTVYVIEDGKARQQQVTLGARQDKVDRNRRGPQGHRSARHEQRESARDRHAACGPAAADEDTARARRPDAAAARAAVAAGGEGAGQ